MPTHITNSTIKSLSTSRCPPDKQCGFSLVEMAIVLVIVGLLVTGGITILATQQDMRRIQDTQTLLDAAKESLIGYAAAHPATDNRPFLPCPDKTTPAGVGIAPNLPNDGIEDRTAAGTCVTQEGNLPWVTLGLTSSDIWSNRLRYRVTAAFSNSVTGMTLGNPAIPIPPSTGDITIIDAAIPANPLASNIPAVILSHGKNGFGAQNSLGITNPAPPAANISETDNADMLAVAPQPRFVSNAPVGIGGDNGEFDDIVTWISPNILFNRMLAAGRLP